MSIVDVMRSKEYFFCAASVSAEDVKEAQSALGCAFADDYREYVQELGVASFDGHELTGICPSPRLNVVEATRRARLRHPELAKSWYVIEELNMDGIMICQDASGSVHEVVHEVVPGCRPCQIASGLKEYIEL